MRYRIIYEKWVNHVRRGFEDGMDINEIYEDLRRVDMNIAVQEEFFKYRGYGEREVLLSLYGIYSYFQWINQGGG